MGPRVSSTGRGDIRVAERCAAAVREGVAEREVQPERGWSSEERRRWGSIGPRAPDLTSATSDVIHVSSTGLYLVPGKEANVCLRDTHVFGLNR